MTEIRPGGPCPTGPPVTCGRDRHWDGQVLGCRLPGMGEGRGQLDGPGGQEDASSPELRPGRSAREGHRAQPCSGSGATSVRSRDLLGLGCRFQSMGARAWRRWPGTARCPPPTPGVHRGPGCLLQGDGGGENTCSYMGQLSREETGLLSAPQEPQHQGHCAEPENVPAEFTAAARVGERALPLPSCVTLGKSLALSEPQHLGFNAEMSGGRPLTWCPLDLCMTLMRRSRHCPRTVLPEARPSG